MVPTQDIQTYLADLQSRGLAVDSTHNFKDLRGGQSGTGDEQTLVYGLVIPHHQPDLEQIQVSQMS
jgi:hypothetical protein